MTRNRAKSSAFWKSAVRVRPVFLVLLVLAIGVLAFLVVVTRQKLLSDDCYCNMMHLHMVIPMSFQGGVYAEALAEGKAKGMTPLVAVLQPDIDDGRGFLLVCPTAKKYSRKLRIEDLTEDLICYETWGWREFAVLPGVSRANAWVLMVWEKQANHKAKRYVCTRGSLPELVNDERFREMKQRSKELLEKVAAERQGGSR